MKEVKLLDICKLATGKHDANHAVENGIYRFYTCSSTYSMCNTYKFQGKCLIFPGNGVNVGDVYRYEGEFDAYQRTYVISGINESIVLYEYLYYHLLYGWKKYGTLKQYGAATNYIKLGNFQDYKLFIPSLSEQQQIVDFLDAEFAKIDELKNQAEQSLQNAKDLFQAALKEMLTPKEGWKECKMGNICELSQGLAINAKTRHLLVEKSSIPLLRIKDMKEGTREIFVDEKLFPPACLANKEDLIYTRTGTLGLIFTGMYGILHNNCFKIKIVEKDINKSFYMYFVGSDSFRTQITKLASRAAQPDITHKLFKEQLFQYPSISEQRDIVNKLNIMQERITALQSNYSRTIQLCADLKQALLRQVFE